MGEANSDGEYTYCRDDNFILKRNRETGRVWHWYEGSWHPCIENGKPMIWESMPETDAFGRLKHP